MNKIRIGTRGSPLALWQANAVKTALERVHAGLFAEITVIKTSGDWKPEQGETLLSEAAGGKAQFAHEIEAALLIGAVDIGVHSTKDMDSNLPDGLVMNCFLPREDVRDCLFVAETACDPGLPLGLKEGAVFGTSSARRAAFLKHIRPDLEISPLRGNVQTRLDKLQAGQVGATMLACAGLKRLGINIKGATLLETDIFIPAAAQGAVGIESRAADQKINRLLSAINHEETALRVVAERAIVKALGGTCRSPIGALAVLEGGRMILRAAISGLDGRHYTEDRLEGSVRNMTDAVDLGRNLGERLKQRVPADLWDAA
ncbi:MAG: hydroxymethylbilane synthase [Alphaproteobacteria bacterium]|nr:hydroxymethylbilane synthase [Alphaproteobacteria bacterium]